MYTIKTLSSLTGVNPDTIRSWERRYNLLSPERTDTGRRTYTDLDVEKLSLIVALLKLGHSIGQLAVQDLDQLKSLKGARPTTSQDELRRQVLDDLKKSVEDRDIRAFSTMINASFNAYPPAELADTILCPILRVIGDRWSIEALDIGDEHAFTAVIKQALYSNLPPASWTRPGPIALFTTLTDELHELGALMACHIAAGSGFNCHYIGPNMPIDDLNTHCRRIEARLVAISVVSGAGPGSIISGLNKLAENLPETTQIWAGFNRHVAIEDGDLHERIITFYTYGPFEKRLALLQAGS